MQKRRMYYYKISDDEGAHIREGVIIWNTARPDPQDIVPCFPEMVSDNSWNYCW